ncbi:endonuclease/Exonuclease/phosphatase [Loa loa]|nr:endonuclease/Exonuclease/phosphatase [Loa loa]EFO20952.2 endonuclease/Exonuclease/phosphatase [Loa loa]
MWWLLRNAVRHCRSRSLYPFPITFFQNCASKSDPVGTSSKNHWRVMKTPLRRNIPYIAKYPENVIMMWIGSTPRIARNKILFTDGMEEHSLHIHFVYCVPHSKTLVEINLARPLDELFLRTCEKIKEKVNKFIHKQPNKVVCDETGASEFVFSAPNHPNLLLSTNEQIYKDENILDVCINNDMYRLLRNPPRCTKLVLKLKPLVGCPLMASFSLAGNSRKVDPSFHWYAGEPGASLILPIVNNIPGGKSKYMMDGWTYRFTGRYFCPGVEDVGKRICVLLDMGSDTIVYCADSGGEVSEVGETLIFEQRQATCCQEYANSRNTRVISYNILANLYLDLKLKQEDLHFPYCAKEYQNYDYRYPILLREIPGYRADIVFLQEVDERLWLRFLPEVMSSHGYDCYFKKKGMKVNEGLVVCFRRNQFRCLESHNMWLPDLLNTETYPENVDIIELLKSSDELNAMFISKPAVIQVLVLDNSSLFAEGNGILLLANTHLYFDPRFEIIKILQALLCARWVVRVATDYANHNPRAKLHILFAGDFNSTPDGPVYHLLSTGNISIKSECCSYSQHPHGDVNFTIQPSFSSFSLKLTSLGDETQFTNYTRHYRYDGQIAGFEGCLDYIWGSTNVKVHKVIPVPPKELAKKYVALPSKISPSDHLPLVCDIQFR